MATKFDLAGRSFSSVLRHVEHEDNKATRIVISMAFITAAAAAVFASVVGDPDPRAIVVGEEVNVTVLTFAIFLAFVVGGTLFMLAALGPKFNLLEEWGKRSDGWTNESSLLFAEVIARHSYGTWSSHWESSEAETLADEMESGFVSEAYLLARKAAYKVRMMSVGRVFYTLALMALTWFLAVSFTNRLELGLPVGGLLASLIAVQLGLESGVAPAGFEGNILSGVSGKDMRSKLRGWLAVMLLLVGMLGLVTSGVFILLTY